MEGRGIGASPLTSMESKNKERSGAGMWAAPPSGLEKVAAFLFGPE